MKVEDLQLKKEFITLTSKKFNIKVKQYLPLDEKFKVIKEVLQIVADEQNFVNELNLKVWSQLAIIKYYSDLELDEYFNNENIDLDKCKELYDLFSVNGLIDDVLKNIPSGEFDLVNSMIDKTVHEFYKYKNSIKGILEAASADYSSLDLDASVIQEKLKDPNNIGFLKEVMDKLG